jgi:hypothetical protein
VTGAAGPNADGAEVRAWAKANDFEVGDRGGLRAEGINAYNAAHPDRTYVRPETLFGSLDLVDHEAFELRRRVLALEQEWSLAQEFTGPQPKRRAAHIKGSKGRLGLTLDQLQALIGAQTEPIITARRLTSSRSRARRHS